MATEKILNTRIQLKYDTLTNWNSSSFILKPGELAIVSLGEIKDGSTAGEVNQHPVLFKVGDGNHTFSQLPFASALAADVFAWAKAARVELVDKKLQFIGSDNTVIKEVAIPYITSNEATNLINSALANYSTSTQVDGKITAAIEALDSTQSQTAGNDGLALSITQVDGKITAISGSIAANTYDAHGAAATAESNAKTYADGLNTAMDTRVQGLETKVGDSTSGLVKDVADLKTAVGEGGSVDSKITAAIEALDNTVTHIDTGDGLTLVVTQVNGKINGVSGAIAANTYDAYGAAATVQENLDKVVDGTTPVAKATNADQLGGVAAADYATKAYVDQAEADAISTANAYTDQIKKEILTGDSTAQLDEAYDTLLEIQNWMKGEGVDATELSTAIAQETSRAKAAEEKIATFDESGALIDGALFDEVNILQGQINALGITDGKVAAAAKADVASSLDTAGVTQVQGIKVNNAASADVATKASGLDASGEAAVKAVKVDNATHADAATKATQDASGNVITTTYETKTDAAQKLTDAKAYTDTREAAIKTAYEAYADQVEVDAKAYADGLAGNYATAAQGLKADSALQEIKAGTGLKVSTKANNEQTIDIDNTVVFVFDCGSATVNID